jgi:hypothetical protein
VPADVSLRRVHDGGVRRLGAGRARGQGAPTRPLPPQGDRRNRAGEGAARANGARGRGARLRLLRHGRRLGLREGPLRRVGCLWRARAAAERARGRTGDGPGRWGLLVPELARAHGPRGAGAYPERRLPQRPSPSPRRRAARAAGLAALGGLAGAAVVAARR